MELTANLIPAWLVAIIMITTGLVWTFTRNRGIRIDSRPFAVTFILQGVIYGMFNIWNTDIEIRGFFVRLSLIFLSLSQMIPLLVGYIRSLRDDD